jgi:hypothetical protein
VAVAILGASTNRTIRSFLYNRLTPVEESVGPAARYPVKGENSMRGKILREKEETPIPQSQQTPIPHSQQIPIPKSQQIPKDPPDVEIEEVSESIKLIKEELVKNSQFTPEQSRNDIVTKAAAIQLKEVAICQDVVDRRPHGKGDRFKSTIGKLYCFTRITLQQPPPTEVTHVWYLEDQEVSRVTLPVRSYHWRTYSLKRILPQEVGSWHVDIVGPEGTILATVAFAVIP